MKRAIDARYGLLFREAIRMGLSLADAKDWAMREFYIRTEERKSG